VLAAAKALEPMHIEPASTSDTEVARRLYQIFPARGREHGDDLDDWLQAERDLPRKP
jgi:hypothetical protein